MSGLWPVVAEMAPGSRGAHLVVAHLARWCLFLLVALFCAALFDGLAGPPTMVAGNVLANVLVLAVCGLTLAFFRPSLYRSLRTVAVVAIVFSVVLVAASVAAGGPAPAPEFVPIALAAVLFSALFDSRVSVFASLVLAALIGIQRAYVGSPALFLLVVVGVAASFSVRVIRRRDQVYYSILVTAAAYVLAELAIGLATAAPVPVVLRALGLGAANSVVSVALALMFLPPLEEFAGIDTYLSLLEWSDMNRPLMRRLSMEAPGTFAHTMRIANLAESASTAIGANGLLARVGSYYHDIGKLDRPEYFVENQPRGRNPHDRLTARESAAIIRAHVLRGVELAEENNLPVSIQAFITEHHGTGRISYFLDKARAAGDNDLAGADEDEFYYPGPSPRTAETAICMLADSAEAAAHALVDPVPARIRDVIEHIVRQRMEEGQLRDAPLTLKQLEMVKEEFARVLIGMYHHRIDYPDSLSAMTRQPATKAVVRGEA